MKDQSGSRGIALLFLEPQRWLGMSSQRHGRFAPGKDQVRIV